MPGVTLSEAYRARHLGRNTIRDLTPPPPSAFAAFGAGSFIVPPCRVSTPGAISIGRGVVILEYGNLSVVEAVDGVAPELTIGDGTQIGAQCQIACVGRIDIGSDVLTAARVFIGDTYHEYEDPDAAVLHQAMKAPKAVVIEDGAFLGIGA
jgi:UDP-3-O-[3-hydroxymyristoyl] glucosamine N-acyltransferase